MEAAQTPISYTQGFILKVLVDTLDELRKATCMADVNIAAGRAWQGLEPYLLTGGEWPLVLDLASEGPDELDVPSGGDVIELPL